MKKIIICLIFLSSNFQLFSQKFTVEEFDINLKIGIRAIAIVNDSTVWFGGNKGACGFTEDNGKHWKLDSIKIDSVMQEFRSIAVTKNGTIFLANAGSPAFILKSSDKGKSWKTIYKNSSKDAFFDSMKFRNDSNGIVIGDPIDSCFIFLQTRDAGKTWNKINCKKLPKPFAGEASFASSNTCLDMYKNNIWMITGGTHSRILHSINNGKTWNSAEIPLIQGEQMTGAYSMDFYDEKTGIIVGGNYDKKELNSKTKCITADGGKTWKLVADGQNPSFGSCVQFIHGSKGKQILLASLPGVFYSNDGGNTWEEIKNEAGEPIKNNYYTFQVSGSAHVAWFAGANGKLMKLSW